MALAASAGLEG